MKTLAPPICHVDARLALDRGADQFRVEHPLEERRRRLGIGTAQVDVMECEPRHGLNVLRSGDRSQSISPRPLRASPKAPPAHSARPHPFRTPPDVLHTVCSPDKNKTG